ncbi:MULTISPECIES: hypothetical protein [unclassified Mycolicibacterium]|uniref:hypothetical protein n=1 Tax=unclassified Mycolicibacterium TaxID=2636767 RepID=UPI0012DCB4CE|nr:MULTISPECIES: hypothetical protein [unclassified Mycolicibacterium]MUL85846.1 hypothetical protein [Mycolicibacterium sp. CBMA 329]MUL90216.1 hypothetical protein [Mycolicibacterium sp. CBMA 331]MUM00985.1 hypothetical protein [Mycolicibacterium sp. CBMA 334]MUM27141.1 hypothetical protein [Mycolicibacterium sp. CBMA 295]MUM39731.1 hypothetical protein [Mycolicibacterium sp. CBMA 247]
MSTPSPFDFSDFGPPARPGPTGPTGPGGRPAPGPGGPSSGFDPWAGQPPAQRQPASQEVFGASPAGYPMGAQDAFGQPITVGPGAAALRTTGPPLVWFAVALGLALAGVIVAVIGAIVGPMLVTAVAGWLLAGPVAIGALAVYTRVDTRRRTDAIYSAPNWTSTLYWAVLAVCLVGIAVGAWQIALWAGRL